MSTIFGLFAREPKLNGHGELHDKDRSIPYIEVAFRDSNGIRWLNNFKIIHKHLKNSTPVYPIDNSPQGIYTIKDIKKNINNEF